MPENGHLLRNLLLFGRLLRGLGLDVNPGRMMDLVSGLRHVEIGRREDFYHAARSLLVHRQEDIELFDRAFEMFWQRPVEHGKSGRVDPLRRRVRRRRPITTPPPRETPWVASEPPPETAEPSPLLQVTRTYSSSELLRRRDFGELSAEELEAVRKMIAEMVWSLGERRTRRFRPGRGPRFDFRRTLRRNLRHGAEILAWSEREARFKPRPLVVIADISGSMERYSRLLLHFIYSLTRGLPQSVEAFLFGTRLTRVSRQMQERDVERALAEVSRVVPDWTGGTRIGEALKTFNYDWARRVLGRRAVVLIISDGWDRGDPELLAREMGRLQRSCYRLIWLNPLLGSPDYEPLTRGMQVALPHVDDFLPVHNLASLEGLARELSGIEGRRHRKRQAAPTM